MSSDRLATSASTIKRGAFSSFSMSLAKSPKEDRQSVPKHTRALSTKSQSQSPVNSRLMNTVGIDHSRSPTRRGRSPLRPTNGKSQVTPRDNVEIIKSQEIVKKLSSQSVSDHKLSRKGNELDGLSKSSSAMDYENLKIEFEKQRKALGKYKHDNSMLVKERDMLLLELNSSYKSLENTRFHLKSITHTMSEVIYTLLSTEKALSDSDSKTELISQIQTLFIHKLNEVISSTSVDFDEEIQMINTWNFQPSTSGALNLRYKQDDSIEINPIDFSNVPSWVVSSERSTNEPNTPKLGSSLACLHPLNPLRNFKNSKLTYFQDESTPELETTDSKNKSRIRRKGESNSQSRQFALAVYDFVGECAGDLSFSRGETVEIVKSNESGWWTGKIGLKIGTFPYNFVQITN